MKRKVFGIIAAISFLIAFGIVGGVESDSISLGWGIVALMISLVVMTVSAKKAGAFDEEKATGREGVSTAAKRNTASRVYNSAERKAI